MNNKTLFNGDKYVIGSIKPKEIDFLLSLAESFNLKIDYLEHLLEAKLNNKELITIYIDDERLGGRVSCLICWHSISINKECKSFSTVKELKKYLKTRNQ